MKAVVLTTLFIGLLTRVEACAPYLQCHCYDADGTPNTNATIAACAEQKGDRTEHGIYYSDVDTDGVTKCFGGRLRNRYAIDNCYFREFCAAANATGPDSWCEFKTQ